MFNLLYKTLTSTLSSTLLITLGAIAVDLSLIKIIAPASAQEVSPSPQT